jgi:hypothetical protein
LDDGREHVLILVRERPVVNGGDGDFEDRARGGQFVLRGVEGGFDRVEVGGDEEALAE